MENAKKFFEELIQSEDVKQRMAACQQAKSPEERVRVYSQIAKELGIDLSEEEITAYFEQKLNNCTASGELDDQELEQLAGGKSNCTSTYRDRENCAWSDGCDYYWNQYSTYRCSWSYEGACVAFSYDDNMNNSPDPKPMRIA